MIQNIWSNLFPLHQNLTHNVCDEYFWKLKHNAQCLQRLEKNKIVKLWVIIRRGFVNIWKIIFMILDTDTWVVGCVWSLLWWTNMWWCNYCWRYVWSRWHVALWSHWLIIIIIIIIIILIFSICNRHNVDMIQWFIVSCHHFTDSDQVSVDRVICNAPNNSTTISSSVAGMIMQGKLNSFKLKNK